MSLLSLSVHNIVFVVNVACMCILCVYCDQGAGVESIVKIEGLECYTMFVCLGY